MLGLVLVYGIIMFIVVIIQLIACYVSDHFFSKRTPTKSKSNLTEK